MTPDEVLEAIDIAIYEASGLSMPKSILVRNAALRAAAAGGWELKPREATEEMRLAAVDAKGFAQHFSPRIAWLAMFSAAPSLTGGDDA